MVTIRLTVVVPENPIRVGSRLKENQGNIICDACHPPSVAMFVADLFKPRRQLEVENLFLRHQLNIALPACTVPSAAAWERPGVVGMDVKALAKPAQVGLDRSA
jgi:hypothetical protein